MNRRLTNRLYVHDRWISAEFSGKAPASWSAAATGRLPALIADSLQQNVLRIRTQVALRIISLILVICASRAASAADDPKPAAPQPIAIREIKRRSPIDFENDVLPIFKANCLACHNQTTTKAELILETPQTIRKGGESGPAVVAGKPNESLLLQVASHQKRPLMPPKDNKVAASELKPEELGLIKLWIEQGAKGEVRANIPVLWRPLPKTIHPIYAVALTRDGQFAACGRGNQIFVYHLPSQQLSARLIDPKLEKNATAHLDLVQSLDFSADGGLLASGAFREVKLWRRSLESKTFQLASVSTNTIFDLAQDARSMAVIVGTNEISIRDTRSNNERQKLAVASSISQVKLSPDSSKLASIDRDRFLGLWSLKEGKLLTKTNLSSDILQVQWLSTNRLATASTSNLIEVWAVSAPENMLSLVKALPAKPGEISSMAGSKEHLVSAESDGTIRLWDLQSGKAVRELKHGAFVTALALSPDGTRIASAGSNNLVRLWSWDGKEIGVLRGDRYRNEAVDAGERMAKLAENDTAFRKKTLQAAESQQTNQADRVTKAIATNEFVAKIIIEKEQKLASAMEAKASAEKLVADLQTQLAAATNATELKKTNAPDASTGTGSASTSASPSTNGIAKVTSDLKDKLKEAAEKLGSASNAWVTAEKEFKKAELTKSIAGHELELAANALVKSVQGVGEARTLLEKSQQLEKEKRGEAEALKKEASAAETVVRNLVFSPDGRVLATSGDDSAVRTWSGESGASFEVYRGDNTLRLGFASTNKLRAVGSGTTLDWDLTPIWRLERTIGKPSGDSPLADRVNAVRFSADGLLLATGGGEPSRSGEIKLWTVADGKLARDLPLIHSDSVLALDFSPDGKLLASGAADKFLRVTSLESGKLLKTFEGHTHHVLGVAWKQDGRTLASPGEDALVKVWNSATAERLKNIEGFGKEVTSLTYIGVADQLLASAGDGQLRLVRDTGENVRSFAGATDYLYASATTPDGKLVVAGGQDGILRVWDGRDGKLIADFPP